VIFFFQLYWSLLKVYLLSLSCRPLETWYFVLFHNRPKSPDFTNESACKSPFCTCIKYSLIIWNINCCRYLYNLTLCGQLFTVWMVLVGLPLTMLNSILFENPLCLNYCQANTSEWNIWPETFVVVARSCSFVASWSFCFNCVCVYVGTKLVELVF